jgi:hypothetical protein
MDKVDKIDCRANGEVVFLTTEPLHLRCLKDVLTGGSHYTHVSSFRRKGIFLSHRGHKTKGQVRPKSRFRKNRRSRPWGFREIFLTKNL